MTLRHQVGTPLWLIISMLAVTTGIVAHFLFGQSWTTISGHAIGSDDAYISYRYAENFFNGHGLVFNRNEYVEGYSNFLYTLLITPAFYFGKSFVYTYSVTLNIILINIALVIYYNFVKTNLDKTSANFGVVLVALSPFIWSNAATGLETILVLCINLSIWSTIETYREIPNQKYLHRLTFLCLLSMLARIDGFIMPLICCLYLSTKKLNQGARHLVSIIIIFMVLYTLLRFYYYGDIIGNTFYNKISGDLIVRLNQGLVFWFYYLLETGMYVAIGVYSYVAIFKSSIKKSATAVSINTTEKTDFALYFIVIWSLYIIYTGGDIYYERFLITLLPMTTYLFLKARLSLKKPMQWYFIGALLIVPFIFVNYDGRFNYQFPKYDFWVATGKFLRANYANKTIAVDACGKIPFYSELKTIDMLGLNDRHIAKLGAQRQGIPGHTKYDANYVLAKSPDLITTWINPNLNLGYGLSKTLYKKNYQVHYLVNSSRHDYQQRNIIDVTTLEKHSVENLIKRGYNYAILTRKN